MTNQVSGRTEQETGTSGTPIFGVLLGEGATPTVYFCARAKPPGENLIVPAGWMGPPRYQLVLSDYREEDTSLETIRRASPEETTPVLPSWPLRSEFKFLLLSTGERGWPLLLGSRFQSCLPTPQGKYSQPGPSCRANVKGSR